jgi:hypothetical protein
MAFVIFRCRLVSCRKRDVCMNHEYLKNETNIYQKSVIKLLLDTMADIDNGTITIIVQDENIIQMNISEKFATAG